jgi:hypothetical protein
VSEGKVGNLDARGWYDLVVLTDAIILDLSERNGPKCDERKLRKLSPWRAYHLATVAVRCGALPQERLDAIRAECQEVGGDGKLRPE